MLRRIQAWLLARRFRRMTAAYDREIAKAREAHKPTRALVEAKRRFVHQALAGGRS